ncbi:helix-turn-helix domain-containing protein [Nocardioides cheoyonin]|uniref:helix-turn-helix domain-containing protein n=1 Tax=Nocardioides cheoyonin TaxID=3156615 RepID=UPI0032B34683
MRIGNPRQFGAVIRAERKERRLTQVQLAEQAGVSRAWLARFETGHPAASIEPIFRVLAALELDLSTVERRISPQEAVVMAAVAERDRRG